MKTKKQTAVDWLIIKYVFSDQPISLEHLQEAFAMEKEQITDAFVMGSLRPDTADASQYYNEIYLK